MQENVQALNQYIESITELTKQASQLLAEATIQAAHVQGVVQELSEQQLNLKLEDTEANTFEDGKFYSMKDLLEGTGVSSKQAFRRLKRDGLYIRVPNNTKPDHKDTFFYVVNEEHDYSWLTKAQFVLGQEPLAYSLSFDPRIVEYVLSLPEA